MLKIKFDKDTKTDQLQALTLPEKKRRTILRNAIRKSRDLAYKRVNQGRNRNEQSWATPKKKNIFKKIKQKKSTYLKTGGSYGEIHYKNTGRGFAGAIAKAHAEGLGVTHTAEQSRESLKNKPAPNYSAPATKLQAKRLIELKYKIWNKQTKRYNEVSTQKYIIDNLTFGRAGFLINLLKAEDKATKKKEWTVERPKRELLGNSEKGARLVRKGIKLDVAKKS